MINWYDKKGVKKLLDTVPNPAYDVHKIKTPFRMLVVAASGGGKTSFLLSMIEKMPNTFCHIYICTRVMEPLYQFLEKTIGSDKITFLYKLSDLPSPDKLEHTSDGQVLVVWDDFVNASEREHEIVREYYLRGRKKRISMCYLSQSYFKVNKFIRCQLTHLILLKLSGKKDLNLIVSDHSLGVEKDELLEMYKQSIKLPFNFFKVDIGESDDNKRFSHNWSGFFQIEPESDEDG